MLSRKRFEKILDLGGQISWKILKSASFEPEQKAFMLSSHEKFLDAIENDWKEGDWDNFLMRFPHRTHILLFLYIRHHLNDKEYYEILGRIINSIYMYDYERLIRYLLRPIGRDVKYMKYMMSAWERKRLATLETNTIFRGCSACNQAGYSWTLSPKHAKFFAERNRGEVFIMKGTFDKSDAIAYWSREKEIFLEPDKVKNITVERAYYNEEASTNSYQHGVHLRVSRATWRDKEYQKIFQEEIPKMPIITNSIYQ